jgi:hypothetical protein
MRGGRALEQLEWAAAAAEAEAEEAAVTGMGDGVHSGRVRGPTLHR